MDSDFKINVYFQEKGEEIEKIIALYLMNVLDKREMKTKFSI